MVLLDHMKFDLQNISIAELVRVVASLINNLTIMFIIKFIFVFLSVLLISGYGKICPPFPPVAYNW